MSPVTRAIARSSAGEVLAKRRAFCALFADAGRCAALCAEALRRQRDGGRAIGVDIGLAPHPRRRPQVDVSASPALSSLSPSGGASRLRPAGGPRSSRRQRRSGGRGNRRAMARRREERLRRLYPDMAFSDDDDDGDGSGSGGGGGGGKTGMGAPLSCRARLISFFVWVGNFADTHTLTHTLTHTHTHTHALLC